MAFPAVSANTPSLGSIAWQAFNIRYANETFAIPGGNTAQRWVWWRWNGGGANSVLEAGSTVPDGSPYFATSFADNPGSSIIVSSSSSGVGQYMTADKNYNLTAIQDTMAFFSSVTRKAYLDQEFTVNIVSDPDNRRHVGAFFQTVDGNARTGLRVAYIDGSWGVTTYVNGTGTAQTRTTVNATTLNLNTVYKIRVTHNFTTRVGSVWVNGVLAATWTLPVNAVSAEGRPGFFAWGTSSTRATSARFDDFKVLDHVPLGDDDLLILGNKNGVPVRVQASQFVDGELIVDGSIIADAMGANSVTAKAIAANAVQTVHLDAGSVNAEKLAARSVSIEKLAMGSLDNLASNPNFYSDTVADGGLALQVPGWTVTAGYVAFTAGNSVTMRAGSTLVNNTPLDTSGLMEPIPGEPLEYRIATFVSPLGFSSQIEVGIQDASGVIKDVLYSGPAVAEWVESIIDSTSSFFPTAGHIYYKVVSGDDVAFAYPDYRRKGVGKLIVDGTIEADQLKADAIDGKVIRGATFYGGLYASAESGRRLEIKHSGGSGRLETYTDYSFESAPGRLAVEFRNEPGIYTFFGGPRIASPTYAEGSGTSGEARIDVLAVREHQPGQPALAKSLKNMIDMWANNVKMVGSESIDLNSPMVRVSSSLLDVGAAGSTRRTRITDSGVDVSDPSGNAGATFSSTDTQARLIAASGKTIVLVGASAQSIVAQLNGGGSFVIGNMPTSASGSPVLASPSGILYRNTSSRRYKDVIGPVQPKQFPILDVEVVTYWSKDEIQRFEETGTASIDPNEIVEPRIHVGVIAEQVEEVGLKEAVIYDNEGTIDSVQYQTLSTLLIPVAQDHEKRLVALEQENAELKDQVSQMESRLAALERLVQNGS